MYIGAKFLIIAMRKSRNAELRCANFTLMVLSNQVLSPINGVQSCTCCGSRHVLLYPQSQEQAKTGPQC
jgi:hypothetical protein